MLPQAYEGPGAILLILGGVVACFAGHRFFRVVLALYGFIFGALIASSIMGISNAIGMLLAGLAGGVIGTLVMLFAWFVGVAIVGAGLGALVAHLIWVRIAGGDPPAAAIVVVSLAGGVGAMLLQRYVVVVCTALVGAWTMLVGVLHLMAARGGAKPAADAVWILYPLPAGSPGWVPLAWLGLGVVGTIVQLGLTSKRKR